jgi:mannose-6-phosphate isomerase-like protein (cupin superfamily)
MYTTDIETEARANNAFRRVLMTTARVQIVVMALQPGEDIGAEVHRHTDQVLTFVEGFASAEVNGDTRSVGPGDIVLVPAGMRHNFINIGNTVLKLYTIYSPPNHAPGTVHLTKAHALRMQDHKVS